MNVGVRGNRPRASVPAMGPWVPIAMLHVLFFAVAAGLCLLVLMPLYLGVGLVLAAAVTLVPDRVPVWCLLIALALSQVWREPSATDITFYLLLAGVHLLHMLGGLTRVLPWVGRIQVRALVGPFQRFAVVQGVAQAVALSGLLAFGGGPGKVPGLSILAAGALGVVVALLVRRLLRS